MISYPVTGCGWNKPRKSVRKKMAHLGCVQTLLAPSCFRIFPFSSRFSMRIPWRAMAVHVHDTRKGSGFQLGKLLHQLYFFGSCKLKISEDSLLHMAILQIMILWLLVCH